MNVGRPSPLRRAALAPALALLVALASLPATPPARAAAQQPLPGSLTLLADGGGWGHGHGMAQYGARARAEAGQTYREILRGYYTGIGFKSRGSSESIRVLMWTAAAMIVGDDYDFVAKWSDGTTIARSSTWPSMRVEATETGVRLQGRKTDGGSWTTITTGTKTIRFYRDGGSFIALHESDGETRYLRGFVEAKRYETASGARLRVINQLLMDQYLYGVVPREMPASWHKQALRAQAVAARTYGAFIKDASSGDYHICATTMCQVYGGYGYRTTGGTLIILEDSRTREAVDATSGLVMIDGSGNAIFSQFHSSSGGQTSQGSRPYLAPVSDPWDRISPHHRWRAKVTVDQVEAKWPELGRLVDIVVTDRDGDGPWGGRVEQVQMIGTTATKTVSGSTFRFAFSWSPSSRPDGIKSTLFKLYRPPFIDDDGLSHEPNIRTIWEEGVTLGCKADGSAFCPRRRVTRAEMAAFLARALGLEAGLIDHFTDDEDSPFEPQINAIRDANITSGCNAAGDLFCPGRNVTRAEMAKFLVEAFDVPPSATNAFTDDDDYRSGAFEPYINAVAAAGITTGCTADGDSFCPGRLVTRAEMATFLARAMPA